MDLIQKFADDIAAVVLFEFLAEHSEPEAHGFIEYLNQYQPARKSWNGGEVDVIAEGHVGLSAFEAVPICSQPSEARFQSPG
jgi:hypothetical protein